MRAPLLTVKSTSIRNENKILEILDLGIKKFILPSREMWTSVTRWLVIIAQYLAIYIDENLPYRKSFCQRRLKNYQIQDQPWKTCPNLQNVAKVAKNGHTGWMWRATNHLQVTTTQPEETLHDARQKFSLSLSLSSTLIFKIRLSIRPARNQVSCVQCDQIWRNFATFAKIKKFWAIFWRLFSIGENFEPVLPNFVCCWAHFNCCKRPNIEKQFCHLVTLQLRECTCMPHHTDDHI